MKKFLTFAVLSLAVVAFWACDDDKSSADPWLKPSAHTIAGTWQLSEWSGGLAADNYVYIEFIRKDRLYKMYQNLDSFSTRLITGEFNIDEDTSVIRGLYDYSLGQEWGHRYIISELSADRMVWTAEDDPEDVSVYVRTTIPDDILSAGNVAEE